MTVNRRFLNAATVPTVRAFKADPAPFHWTRR